MCNLFVLRDIKGIVGLDLRWNYDIKLFPSKKLASDWIT